MKTIHDASVSKRPIQVPDTEDIAQLYLKKEFVQAEIDLLEAEREKLENSTAFQWLVGRSQDRERELLMALACISPDETIKIATIQGQLAERKKLTGEILSLQNETQIKRGIIEKFNDTIAKWSERLARWQAKQGDK